MGIEAIGTGIKTTILATITSGLRVFATNEVPDSLNDFPCLIILLGPGQYATTYGGKHDATYRLILALAKQDTPAAYNALLDFVEASGAKSIFAALDADKTLDSSCDSSKLEGYSGASSSNWGGITYLSCEFELAVWS